jgi:hypothetical protein
MRSDRSLRAGMFTFCVLSLTAIRVGAQSVQRTSEAYSWSGLPRRIRRR